MQPEERDTHEHAQRAVADEVQKVPDALVRHGRQLDGHAQVHKVAHGRLQPHTRYVRYHMHSPRLRAATHPDGLLAHVQRPDLQRAARALHVALVEERADGRDAQQHLDDVGLRAGQQLALVVLLHPAAQGRSRSVISEPLTRPFKKIRESTLPGSTIRPMVRYTGNIFVITGIGVFFRSFITFF